MHLLVTAIKEAQKDKRTIDYIIIYSSALWYQVLLSPIVVRENDDFSFMGIRLVYQFLKSPDSPCVVIYKKLLNSGTWAHWPKKPL